MSLAVACNPLTVRLCQLLDISVPSAYPVLFAQLISFLLATTADGCDVQASFLKVRQLHLHEST